MPQLPVAISDWLGEGSQVDLSHHDGHAMSRRAFLGGAAAGSTGVLLGSGLLRPALAAAETGAIASGTAAPKPTTNKVTINGVTFSLTGFAPGTDPSSITDFKGVVGVADVRGTGTASYPDGHTETLLYDTDMRFMSGTYVGQDNRVHQGTFGFV
jgi:hypothetical protein